MSNKGYVIRSRIEGQFVHINDCLDSRGVCCTDASQVAAVCTWTSQFRCEIIPGRDAARGWRHTVAVLTTLKNGSPERWRRAFGEASQECIDGEGSRALAEDGDLGWVSSKGMNVALDPIESKALIEEAKIMSGNRQLW